MKKQMEKNIYQSMVVERPKRKAVQFRAILINGDKKYKGYIINISDRGVGIYIKTYFSQSVINCTKGSILDLELESPQGEIIILKCKIRWLRVKKFDPTSLTTSMGMEAINPPLSFVKLFENLP